MGVALYPPLSVPFQTLLFPSKTTVLCCIHCPPSCLENCASKKGQKDGAWERGWQRAGLLDSILQSLGCSVSVDKWVYSFNRYFLSPKSQLYVGHKVVENGTDTVYHHSEDDMCVCP